MFRRSFLQTLGGLAPLSMLPAGQTLATTAPLFEKKLSGRAYWLDYLQKLAQPVLGNMAKDELRQNMPVFLKQTGNRESRLRAVNLEAFGRLMLGIAPWLQLEGLTGDEKNLQQQYKQLAAAALANGANPQAKDYLYWDDSYQCLVDAAFLASALVYCPDLWKTASDTTKSQLIEGFLKTRNIPPYFSNWLLFSGMVEAFFCSIGEPYDKMRVDYCLRQHEEWYKGDGFFGDGPDFHFDYYNSYVIQPLMNQILDVISVHDNRYDGLRKKLAGISKRYAEIQEKMINADGSYPAIGRSICYRGGAFHHLAFMAHRQALPDHLPPAQVRCALQAVIQKTTEHPKTFANGWLNPGLYGYQPGLAEYYISTGALYLASFILLPMGLPPSHAFWTGTDMDWTAKKIWSGQDVTADHAS